GSVVGGICGASVLALFYLKHKKDIYAEMDTQKQEVVSTTFKSVAKVVLVLAVPISIGAAVNSVMNFLDSAIVTAGLVSGGMDQTVAADLFGQLTNTLTLVNLPLAFGMALVTSVVPAIAEAVARKDHKEMQDKMELGSRFGLLISLPAAIGLAVLAEPVMGFLFPESLQGGPILRLSAFSIPFIMLGQAMTGVLQGLGKVWIPVQALGIAAVVKAVLNVILVGSMGILGAPLSSIAGYATFTLYNFLAVKKQTGFKLNTMLVIVKPLIAAAVMGVAAYFGYGLLGNILDATSKMQNAVMTIGAVGIGAIVYAIVILLTGGISKQDLQELKKKKEN
ncbi:MAG: polysaccharide biosynthesis C-terminal domain-containing protein, partial [Niameybacter sp.]